MAIESKEVVMYVKKATLSSIRVSYRSVLAHPYISGMLIFILLLSRAFPSLFSFLVSSSPVIVCTTILLGTLLSYGTPNIPEIEEVDKKTRKIFSTQTESAVDDTFVKKDESFPVETNLETGKMASAAGTSNSASVEMVRDVPFAKMYDEGYGSDNTTLTTSSLLHGKLKEMHSEMKVMKEREVSEREISVNDENEVEGLTIQIAQIASDSPFDSSLGSPWQPVDNIDASSGSDSNGAESSSPDASMADIIPMLNELDPLLKSEHSGATLSWNDNSDSSSSGSLQDHELEEVENKEEEIEECHEQDDSNEVAVVWNENDQNNVMDLGYSEIERNRRLENLIARRRLRKLQSFVTEKNLIDLDSLYPTSIPSISAPRRNPFDLPYDYGDNLNLPPIPGSAPSVMQPRKNPFELPYDQEEEISTMSREYLSHQAVQRDVLSQRHELSTAGTSLLGDFSQETEDSKLIEPKLHPGSIMLLSPVSHDVDNVEQEKKSSGATVITEEAHRSATSFGVTEGEIRDVENTSPVSDARKLEVSEERYKDSSFSSSESDEKISRVNSYEESTNLEETSPDSMQSKQVDDAPAVNPVYDSSLSAMKETISNISTHDEAFIYACTENVVSNSLPSDVQADFVHGSLPQRPSEADVSFEYQDVVVVRGEEEDSALGMVEAPESSSGDIPPTAAMPAPESLTSMDSESNEDCTVDVDIKVQSEGNKMIYEPSSVDASESRIEDSQSRSLDLLSTTEENLEDHKSVIESLDEKSGDGLRENPIFQTHNDKFPGSALTDMKLKHEMGPIDDSSGSQRTVTDDILSKGEGGFLRNLSNPDDEVHDEVSRLTYIDEGLLSELDVVGDFLAERELKSDQEGSNQEIVQVGSMIEDSSAESQDSRVSPMKCDDPELTVYNAKLHVLEARSLESDVPYMSDLTIENPVMSESEKVSSKLGMSNKNQEREEIDRDLVVLEATSVEDISAALKQLDKQSIVEVEASEVRPEIMHVETEEINSGFHVVDAKTIEDKNLASKQVFDATVESHQVEAKHENARNEIEVSGKKLELEVIKVHSSEASEVLSAEEIKLDSAEVSSEKLDGNENLASSASASTSSKVRKKKSGSSGSDSSSSSSSGSSGSE